MSYQCKISRAKSCSHAGCNKDYWCQWADLPGKQYAGKTVTVDQVEDGVWTIKTAQVIPDNELWLHAPEGRASLDRALDWSASHPRLETDLKTVATRVNRKR